MISFLSFDNNERLFAYQIMPGINTSIFYVTVD